MYNNGLQNDQVKRGHILNIKKGTSGLREPHLKSVRFKTHNTSIR